MSTKRNDSNNEARTVTNESCTTRASMQPLEFTECVVDSPTFRQNLHAHEKELDSTIQAVKNIEQKTREVLKKVEELSDAQRDWTEALRKTRMEDISVRIQGSVEETVLRSSFAQFASVIDEIEEQHKTIVQVAKDSFLEPLRKFRKEDLGEVVDARNRFREATKRFCSQSEQHAAFRVTPKVDEQTRRNEDSQFDKDRLEYIEHAFDYVHKIHCAQERKKFVFIEVLLTYMNQWRVFYKNAKETFDGSSEYLQELQILLQKSRENYGAFVQKSVELQTEMRARVRDPATLEQVSTTADKKEGYLLALRSRFARTDVEKFFCVYDRPSKCLTMTPFIQTQTHLRDNVSPLRHSVSVIDRKSPDKSVDLRRFCFDVTLLPQPQSPSPQPSSPAPAGVITVTLQCFTQVEADAWFGAIAETGKSTLSVRNARDALAFTLNDVTIINAARCIDAIERRAIEMPGVYRVPGNKQKQKELVETMASNQLVNMEAYEGCESTVTSSLKACIRGLQPAIIPISQYDNYLKLVQLETDARLNGLAALLSELATPNKTLLRIFMHHLLRIAAHSEQNRMTVTNLAVCVGPSILHSAQPDTMQAASELPYVNSIVECMIQHAERLFGPDELESILRAASDAAMLEPPAELEPAVPPDRDQRSHTPSSGSVRARNPSGNTCEEPARESNAATRPDQPAASADPRPTEKTNQLVADGIPSVAECTPKQSSSSPADSARATKLACSAPPSEPSSPTLHSRPPLSDPPPRGEPPVDTASNVPLSHAAKSPSPCGSARQPAATVDVHERRVNSQPNASTPSRLSAPAGDQHSEPRGSASGPSQQRPRSRFGSSRGRSSNAFNFVRGWATALSNSAHLAARIAGESVDRSSKFLSLPVQRGGGDDRTDSVFDSQLSADEATKRAQRVPRATTVSAPSFGVETELDYIDDQQG